MTVVWWRFILFYCNCSLSTLSLCLEQEIYCIAQNGRGALSAAVIVIKQKQTHRSKRSLLAFFPIIYLVMVFLSVLFFFLLNVPEAFNVQLSLKYLFQVVSVFISLLFPQWTFGPWAASWQRCCKQNRFSKEEIVSSHNRLLTKSQPSWFQMILVPLKPLTAPGVQTWISWRKSWKQQGRRLKSSSPNWNLRT